jgi:hypothetical protein
MTQGSIILPPPVVTIEAVGMTRASGLLAQWSAGGVNYPRVGAGGTWMPIASYKTSQVQTTDWISALGIDGGSTTISTIYCNLDEATGDVYVSATVAPNLASTTPFEVGAYDTNGVRQIFAETFDNTVGGGQSLEPFVAKFNQDGVPIWIKRICNKQTPNLTTEKAGFTFWIDTALPDRILVGLQQGEASAGSGVNTTYVYGPGDPNEQTFTTDRSNRFQSVVHLSKANGEILDVAVAIATGPLPTFLSTGIELLGARRWSSPATGRYGHIVSISNFNKAARLLANTGSPVNLVSPGASGYMGAAGVYDASPLGLLHVPQVGNGAGSASETMTMISVLGDGSVIWGGSTPGQGPGPNFTQATGPTFTPPNFNVDDQPFIALYDAAGNASWVKAIGKTNGANQLFFPANHLDDPDNNRIFVMWRTTNNPGTLTFGVGETGQRAWVVPSTAGGRRHVAITSHNRATGDLNWVNTIEHEAGQNQRAEGPMRLVDGVLRHSFTARSRHRFDQINGGVLVDYGSPILHVASCDHDPATGAFLGQRIITTITDDSTEFMRHAHLEGSGNP